MQLKRKILLLFFYFNVFSFSILLGQEYEELYERRSDSLFLAVKNAEGNKKIELAKSYSKEYYKLRPAKVLSLIDIIVEEQTLSSLDSAHFYLFKSRVIRGENKELSEQLFNISANILDTHKGPATKQFHYLKCIQNMDIGLYYQTSGAISKARPYFLKALSYAKESQDKPISLYIYTLLGYNALFEQDETKAIEYFLNGSKLFKENTGLKETDHFIKIAHIQLATLYTKTNQLDLAKEHIAWLEPRKNSNMVIQALAEYYQKTNQDLKVIELLTPRIQELEKEDSKSKFLLPLFEQLVGNSYLNLNQDEKGETYLLKAHLNVKKHNNFRISQEILNDLYKYYKKRGNFEKSIIYFEKYKLYNDSTLSTKHQSYIKGMEANYNLKIKEEENKVLQEQEINRTEVIQRQRWIGLLSAGIILFLIGTTISYFRNAKTKKKLNTKLKENNEILTSKNLQIKANADELMFITDNFPEAIGRLDKNFKLVFCNEKLSKLLNLSNDAPSASNIFQLLQFPNHDEASIISDLRENDNLDFIWLPEKKEEVYQVKFLSLGNVEDDKSYLLIVSDVTYIKRQGQKKIDDMQFLLTNLEEAKKLESKEKDLLSVSLERKKKELTSNILQISRRNSNLENILVSLKDIYKNSTSTNKKKIDKVMSQLQINLEGEDEWKTFNIYFQEIYPSFLATLRSYEGKLSNNEIRHCTFIKLGLNIKEVADMLNVSSKTVEVARYRIKKKLNLSKEDSLSSYITNIE